MRGEVDESHVLAYASHSRRLEIVEFRLRYFGHDAFSFRVFARDYRLQQMSNKWQHLSQGKYTQGQSYKRDEWFVY